MPLQLTGKCDVDAAGGGIVRALGQLFVTQWALGDSPRILPVVGDPVDTHAGHSGATMAAGSAFVFASPLSGPPRAICRNADAATCAHTLIGTGFVTIDGA